MYANILEENRTGKDPRKRKQREVWGGRESRREAGEGEGGVYSVGEMYSISCMAVVV